MLLLLTILLVLVAAVTLLIGIFSDELTLIWISIASSFGAAVVLGVLSQMSRKRVRATPAAEAPAPAAPAPAPAAVAEPTLAAPLGERAEGERTAPQPTVAPAVAPAGEEEPVTVDELPIDGYDDLRVSEILPELDELDLDELELVAIYEEDNKNRTTVLNRIDELIEEREAEETAPAPLAPAAAAATVGGGEEPIPGYDDMSVREILDRIDELDADELDALAAYEEDNKDRVTLLNAIDARLDEFEGGAEPAPVKKAATKKAAKRAPKKAAAKKTAKKAPAKKRAAKKSAAKKTATKKTGAKKTGAKKTVAKKATKRAKKTAKKSTKRR